ncbi:DUF488 domain-containing protein [Sulfurimonas sp. HSL-3221]|uniref:DUF488 domain-containing protein n=1 Tax=Sulfurimonadaceae TaxID=2771471 RepID=UPI001E62E3CE|nr:DUF488 domain-containing protein [Sulfurimonas sp. HSL-3221]UFS62751.1 DUF488 domain-containing protein [Sulfurimonas sp. HSL-3221]
MKTQPTFYRQRLLLSLIHAFKRPLSKLDLQKLLFLFVEEVQTSKKKAYEFVPYHYGCYSFQANADLRTLHNYAFIQINDEENLINGLESEGNSLSGLKEKDKHAILSFASKYEDLSGNDLIAYVYKNYPYYTLHSKIAHKFLEKRYQKEPKLIDDGVMLFTIGYEGITFEHYVNLLINNDIKVLCDVRKNPFSMKFGFSKHMLKSTLEKIGIRYLHLPELGIESENRQELNDISDYQMLFADYQRETIPSDVAQNALKYINDIASNEKIALTCFEKDIEYCHRGVIAENLKKMFGLGYNNIS